MRISYKISDFGEGGLGVFSWAGGRFAGDFSAIRGMRMLVRVLRGNFFGVKKYCDINLAIIEGWN